MYKKMPIIPETVVVSLDISFFVYDPRGNLLFQEKNNWKIVEDNFEANTLIFGTNGSSGAVVSEDNQGIHVSFGDFSFLLTPLYHGATVSGTQSLSNGSVSCLIVPILEPWIKDEPVDVQTTELMNTSSSSTESNVIWTYSRQVNNGNIYTNFILRFVTGTFTSSDIPSELNQTSRKIYSVICIITGILVTEIAENAFYEYKLLTQLILPNSIKTIEESALSNLILINFQFPINHNFNTISESCCAYTNFRNKGNKSHILYIYDNVQTIEEKAFYNLSCNLDFIFDKGVTNIKSKAFAKEKNSNFSIKRLKIQSTKLKNENVDSDAFDGQSNIKITMNQTAATNLGVSAGSNKKFFGATDCKISLFTDETKI
jgi:hypothetical protein